MNLHDHDSIFEAMLRQAVWDNVYEEADSVPDDTTLAKMFAISEKHEVRMRRLCMREDHRKRNRVIIACFKHVAVASMLIITVLFSSLMMYTPVRAAVIEVVIEWYDQFTRFVGVIDEESSGYSDSIDWRPTYLPEGYVEVDVFVGGQTIVEYENNSGDVLLFRYTSDRNDLLVDNEEFQYTEERVDGVTYYIFDAESENKSNSVVWLFNGYRYDLSSQLEVNTLLEIAKSIEIKIF